jgi:hypothetical protein
LFTGLKISITLLEDEDAVPNDDFGAVDSAESFAPETAGFLTSESTGISASFFSWARSVIPTNLSKIISGFGVITLRLKS